MNNFHRFIKQVRPYLFLIVLVNNGLLIATWWALSTYTSLSTVVIVCATAVLAFLSAGLTAILASDFIMQPLRAVWQAIVHLAPSGDSVPAPKVDDLKLGRELVASLTAQLYQLTGTAAHLGTSPASHSLDPRSNFVASSLPLPLILINKDRNIVFANDETVKYLALEENPTGKSLYSILNMSFNSNATFDEWLKASEGHAATATKSWERVKATLADQTTTRLFDLAAYYNQDNPQGIETMLVIFDHTSQYSQDDQALGFVALTVHELRTPLTLLRGYIEVFEEELAGKLNPELSDFMHKMSASAQQLAAFVNNILNVARIEDDQLVLQLQKQDWGSVVKSAVDTMALRAKVRGIVIEYSLAPDLPPVGADRVAIYEVLSNLLDNAIKYSGTSKQIKVSSFVNQEGLVETAVQDFGVGIPESLMPNLFNKFYRSHRNRSEIGGTGLGLYLSKAIVTAHGGNIWVRSKEDESTTFSFTLLPYDNLAEARKNNDNKDIVRSAHGWIKNHSLYRR